MRQPASATGFPVLTAHSKKPTRRPAAQSPAPRPAADGARGPRNGDLPAGESAAKPASIYDVAKMAGVSIKTVTRVVNQLGGVTEPTRARVAQAIDALSYKPNFFARGLASGRSFLIGLLCDVPAAGSSYIAELQKGMASVCREAGYHLIIESVDAQRADLDRIVSSFIARSRLHAVVLTPPVCDSRTVIHALNEAKTPFVRIAPQRQLPNAIDVCIDNKQAAYEMTSYLIGLGHRHIGFIKGTADHGDAVARYEGYRAALADNRLAFREEFCAQGSFTYQSGLEAGEKLLTLKTRPTAIFAGNDEMAAGVIATCQRFDLRVPQDLALAGFDDSLIARVVWPKLTTCRQPIEEMARLAVLLLVGGSTGDRPAERMLNYELVVRESTAPPLPAQHH